MTGLRIPEFRTYEGEAGYWDNLVTGAAMEDDGEWFTFRTPGKRAVRVAILPEVAGEPAHQVCARGVWLETLVTVFLVAHIHEPS